ncbi:MAG: peptidase M19 [Hirschia sp.]|nr:peptidase M19 [Hirschia sp.]MBF18076.1 peptidase M19 [Hirschia sp.]
MTAHPFRTTLLSCVAFLAGACATATGPSSEEDIVSSEEVVVETEEMSPSRAMHERAIVMDTHLDTPANLVLPGFDIMERHDPALDYSQVDLPRMVEGGLDGGFWVIYTPQGPLATEAYEAVRDTAILRSLAIHKMVAANPDYFEIATKSTDAARIEGEGKRIVYQSIENAYPLGEDLSLLKTFYRLGVRMVGPVHFANNQFGDSATDPEGPDNDGLSALGFELVKEANRLGILLDGSHAHDLTVYDMMEASKTPIILSHSGARNVFDHPRNVDDALLLKLKETGGVIQMNALGAYLKVLQTQPAKRAAIMKLRKEMGDVDQMTEEDYQTYLETRRAIDAEFPSDMADFDDYMEHFIHVLDLIGPDHVGVGADWDGGGGVVGMQDIAAFPLITERLIDAGYAEEDIKKIWGGNVIRLLGEAEEYAASLKE